MMTTNEETRFGCCKADDPHSETATHLVRGIHQSIQIQYGNHHPHPHHDGNYDYDHDDNYDNDHHDDYDSNHHDYYDHHGDYDNEQSEFEI